MISVEIKSLPNFEVTRKPASKSWENSGLNNNTTILPENTNNLSFAELLKKAQFDNKSAFEKNISTPPVNHFAANLRSSFGQITASEQVERKPYDEQFPKKELYQALPEKPYLNHIPDSYSGSVAAGARNFNGYENSLGQSAYENSTTQDAISYAANSAKDSNLNSADFAGPLSQSSKGMVDDNTKNAELPMVESGNQKSLRQIAEAVMKSSELIGGSENSISGSLNEILHQKQDLPENKSIADKKEDPAYGPQKKSELKAGLEKFNEKHNERINEKFNSQSINRSSQTNVTNTSDFNQQKVQIQVNQDYLQKTQQLTRKASFEAAQIWANQTNPELKSLAEKTARQALVTAKIQNSQRLENVSRETKSDMITKLSAKEIKPELNTAQAVSTLGSSTDSAAAKSSANDKENSFANFSQSQLANKAASVAKSELNQVMQTSQEAIFRKEIIEKFESLIQRAKIMVKDQNNASISTRLNPGELGSMTLDIVMQDGVFNAKLTVNSETVQQKLLQQSDELLKQFAQADLQIAGFSIDLSKNFQNHSANSDLQELSRVKETKPSLSISDEFDYFKRQAGAVYA